MNDRMSWHGILVGLGLSALLWCALLSLTGCVSAMECRMQQVPMTWADGTQSAIEMQVCQRRW